MPQPEPHQIPPPEPAPKEAPPLSQSAFAPLKIPDYRLLWGTWLVANICMWMNDVAAAWLMTSMTTSPLLVALVQTAATLPVFLLGLPSGALADILDRRRYYLFTQIWVAVVSILLSITILVGAMTPVLLLALLFVNGVGLAMRWPVNAAIVPELVPRAQLPSALALNGVAMNASRIIGPLIAGAIIAGLGSAYVFVLNAALTIAISFVIMRWKREHVPHPLGRERLFSAIRVGVQYVSQSARLKAVLLRIFLFFLNSTSTMALLPLIARGLEGGNAQTFTLLLACMGAGAIFSAVLLPRLRQTISRDPLVWYGTVTHAISTAIVAFAPNVYIAAAGMFLSGMAWLATANSLSVSAQLALPDWVRARGMAMYQMGIMGGGALGAALWGQVASMATVNTSLAISAVSGVICMFLAQRYVGDRSIEEDLTPLRTFRLPVAVDTPKKGNVLITLEYRIDPSRAADFRKLMQESRRSRLRQGALSWDLLHDISEPGRFIEQIVDESWTEHLRRFDRVTASDVDLRERKLAFHISETPPVVTRYVID